VKKTKVALVLLTILLVSVTCIRVLGENTVPVSPGPAPNSGDGVADGSGFDKNYWPNNEDIAKGPAPNSGDCIPDGSGF
jgi:hypothetical protein